LHPLVVADVCARRAGEAQDGGGETGGDDAGESKLLHVIPSFDYCFQ
jgi:hypothetical protein